MSQYKDDRCSYENLKDYDCHRLPSKPRNAEHKETQAVYFVPLQCTSAPQEVVAQFGDKSERPSTEQTEDSALLTHHTVPYIAPRTMSARLCAKYDHVWKSRSLIVDILAIFFGIGTWVGINGTFIQLPLLVDEAPEGWSLPSYLSVMVQIGNLGPLAYTLVQRFSRHKKKDANMIYVLLAVGTASSLFTAFFYNRTAPIFGEEHSVALFLLTIFMAISACTSSVLFMPYMGRFKEIYMVTYFIGEGLSGLVPSVIALVQGIGGPAQCILYNITVTGKEVYEKFQPPPRFGSTEFFIFVFAMMLCSCIGFTLLDRLELSKQQYAAVQVANGNSYVYERDTKAEVRIGRSGEDNELASQVNPDLAPEISACQYRSLLLLIGVVSFFSNGMFNSILSYSCMPYGGQAYHLSATLSVIANPVACFLAVFLPHTSLRSIATLTGLAGILTVYVFLTAAMSPLPPLHGTAAGSVIVITTWTVLIGLVSYIKLCITTVMRAQGGQSLVWTGGLTQVGSLFGSVLIFALINFTHRFQTAYNELC